MQLKDRMLGGQGPATPEEWHELAVLLTGLVGFANAVHAELDAIGEALDAALVESEEVTEWKAVRSKQALSDCSKKSYRRREHTSRRRCARPQTESLPDG
jgi:hypothetical protein